MATTLITPVEDRKRLARRLAGSGRGFAEQYGFRVTNNPASLFQVLYLSVLLARRGDFRRALDGAPGVARRGVGQRGPAGPFAARGPGPGAARQRPAR